MSTTTASTSSSSVDDVSHLLASPTNPPTDFSPTNKTPPLYNPATKQYDNPWPTWHHNSFTEVARMIFSSRGAKPLANLNLDEALPIIHPTFGGSSGDGGSDLTSSSHVYYTWIGHATALVQLYGVNVLIDPIFSERCSAVQFAGPKRYRPIPCTVDELPPIDIVLISHNHYDHLDYHSCQQLARRGDEERKRTGRVMRWYVGKGIEQWLMDNCSVRKEDAVGMVWWQQTSHTPPPPPPLTSQQQQQHDNSTASTTTTAAAVEPSTSHSASSSSSTAAATASQPLITAVPCQHISMRSPLGDMKKSLWCGFTVTHRNFTFYYSGDTAYCAAFKQIGQHSPHIDLAILPIGAYEPFWFMKYVHVNPMQAIDMLMDVKATKAVAVHWGTFILTTEPAMDPKIQLEAELKKRGIEEDKFVTTKHGETILVK